jgi:hypothetical protein
MNSDIFEIFDPQYLSLEESDKGAPETEKEVSKFPPFTFYFCGKIAHTDWRHRLVDLREVEYPVDAYRAGNTPILRHGLGPGLHYGGPFFVGCDHGCYHGTNSHGAGCNNERPSTCREALPREHEIVGNSLRSIIGADIIFAWIDDLSAYGSFAELGIAYGLAHTIWIAWPKPLPDLWFIQQMASVTVVAETPQLAFRELLFTQLNRSLL